MEQEHQDLSVEEMQLKQIEEMKQKMDEMIDPEQYKKLKADYDKLLNEYVNKRQPPKKQESEQVRPAVEIARELSKITDGDMTNRDYIKKSLEYRKAYIAETGKDPWTDFTVNGSGQPTPKTEYIASALQQLVDENENPVDFRIKLHSVMQDDPAVISALRERDKTSRKAS